jgi:hypothetical protein
MPRIDAPPVKKPAPVLGNSEILNLKPFWQTTDGATVRLYLGHVLDVLAALPERSVHMCVTSPPYFGLRDYGTGTWEGGDPNCDHVERTAEDIHKSSTLGPTAAQRALGGGREHTATNAAFQSLVRRYKGLCGKCGASSIDMQIGSEPSPDCLSRGQAQCGKCFVCTMIAVFRGVKRVLRDDGTLWLNLGSSYWGGGKVSDNGFKGSAAETGGVVVGDENVPYVLRDDLTADEIQYVLSELASRVS